MCFKFTCKHALLRCMIIGANSNSQNSITEGSRVIVIVMESASIA